MTDSDEDRVTELLTLKAIYGDSLMLSNDYDGYINIPIALQKPVQLLCHSLGDQEINVAHLPPVRICFRLSDGYPGEVAPAIELKASWLPEKLAHKLGEDITLVWEEYGHTQVMYAYISQLEEAAELAFGVEALEVNVNALNCLVEHDRKTRRLSFEQGTYECGVCLGPKKGSLCHQMEECRHVLCVECLQGYDNNAILTGNINSVKCPAFECGGTRTLRARLVTPRELLQVPVERPAVQRYVDLKRKKKLESDKTTVWCPRQWCQGAAIGNKYPRSKVPLEEMGIVFEEESSPAYDNEQSAEGNDYDEVAKEDELLSSRLQICEDCSYAFCRLCSHTWHGDFFDCRARTAKTSERTIAEIEEEASLDFIRQHTSRCPKCEVPVQKSEACNHMTCVQCRTHFCYLCSAFLSPIHPYPHFNRPGSFCHQRLWEGQGGEDVER
ncbi:hypothetical protein OPT61_g5669 [Boeremia exigua]|uniref:Uncharacterized protein n=1 Tax=Boeremia exigua TaxID=749465 RepID=A0ACC2I9F4_9PLEO|nr:hypothetical protein OPT61_g5669 [Boeremia exigua]